MLIFTDKLPLSNRSAIIQKINSVSANLGINPNWLMAVINFETAGTFSPSIQNSTSGATGLIQFMPTTAIGLGTTTSELARMSFIQQLSYVESYYRPYKSKLKSFVDLYLATFYPVSIGKPNSYVIGSTLARQQLIARQNPIFDPFKTGRVTVGAIKAALLAKVPAQYAKYVIGANSPFLLLGLLGIAVAAIAYNNPQKKKSNGTR